VCVREREMRDAERKIRVSGDSSTKISGCCLKCSRQVRKGKTKKGGRREGDFTYIIGFLK
jgi:hypothetical protein